MKRWTSLLCLVCFCCAVFSQRSFSQDASEGSQQDPTEITDETEIREPQPYTEDEFPQWAHNLRRFEIITLGTLPITFLATFLVYDLIRYTSSGFDADYALLGSPNPVPYSTEEKIGVVVAACSASLLIALADFIIGKTRQSSEKSSHEQY